MDTELLIFKHALLPMVAIVVPVLSLAFIVGLVRMFWIMGLPWLIGVGLLVLCIGLAQLLALWLEHRLPAAR